MTPLTHLAGAAFCLFVAIPVLAVSRTIPELGYDAMGGRAFPVGLAIALIGLASAKTVLAVGARKTPAASRSTASGWLVKDLSREQCVVLATTFLYFAAILLGVAGFIALSAVYMAISGILSRPERKSILETLAITALVVLTLVVLQQFLGMSMIGA